MKFAIFPILTKGLALSGCASVSESYGPDGRKAYTLNCRETARGWDKCLSKAGEICTTTGYDVLDRSGETPASIGGNRSCFTAHKALIARWLYLARAQSHKEAEE